MNTLRKYVVQYWTLIIPVPSPPPPLFCLHDLYPLNKLSEIDALQSRAQAALN
jgi:hypothetical protein